MVLSFEDSGNPNLAFGLKEARELALAHGFTRPAPAGGAPQPDLDALFAAYGCKALSPFKKRFCSEKLAPPGAAGAVAPQTPTKAAKSGFEPEAPISCVPLPVSEFAAKSESSWWEKTLKWKLIMRPGGAYIQPDDWYRLYAAVNQAKQGDVVTERPMWADHGGIDFHGRACWDAWAELKGMSRDDAIAKFCRVYAESESDARWSINFHGAIAKKLNF